MKKISRREAIACTVFSAGISVGSAIGAQEYSPEGRYRLIKPVRLLEPSKKIEVVDIFWYGCPHCYQFLPYMEKWTETAAPDVILRRLPAVFRDSWAPHARAFYTAAVLGVSHELHPLIFHAMHTEKRALNTKREFSKFFVEYGINENSFSETYDSFAVDRLTRQSEVMPRRWNVQGTPSLIINGRYLVSGKLAGSYIDMVKVADALIVKERESKV